MLWPGSSTQTCIQIMDPPRQVVVASKNSDKISEIEALLEEAGWESSIVRGLVWPDIEETGETLAANASLKARTVAAATGLPAIADDTGLEVAALNGAPGVHTSRYAGPNASYDENVARLLAELRDANDRRALFRTVVVLAFPDGGDLMAEGRLEGNISLRPRGTLGFGYDPVFEVDGRTLGEMTSPEKNSVSHRARALRALLQKLVG